MRVIWSEPALEDLDDIFEYILAENVQAAGRVLERVDEGVARLATHPAMGRPGSIVGTRELVIAGTPYVAAYEIDTAGDAVHILAVRHGARLWPDAFRG